MTQQDERVDNTKEIGTTRRNALKVGGTALGLLATTLGSRSVIALQEATPAAGTADGGYAVVRFRQVREDRNGEELLKMIRDGYVPLAREIPGFISYTAIADPASRNQVFIAVFEDKTGSDESTRLAGEWLQDNDIDHFEGDPVVVEGEIAYTITPEAR